MNHLFKVTAMLFSGPPCQIIPKDNIYVSFTSLNLVVYNVSGRQQDFFNIIILYYYRLSQNLKILFSE